MLAEVEAVVAEHLRLPRELVRQLRIALFQVQSPEFHPNNFFQIMKLTKMKSLLHSILAALLMASTLSAQAQQYDQDPQAQYPQDQTQETFEFASFIACFMKAMAPELSVGVGQYLAYVDENKCENDGSSASTSSATGGSTVVPPRFAKALTTVTQGSNGELNLQALVSITDEENGTQIPKRIQVIATIYAGSVVEPPYGRWNMDFCSSTVGSEGSCNDGQGFLRLSSTGIESYNRWSTGYRSGKSVFTGTSGKSGYGAAASEDSVYRNNNTNALFAFAPPPTTGGTATYSLQPDRNSASKSCYNPSTSASGVRYSVWENFLYSTATRNKITYQNPGFYLKSNLSGRTIGDVSYWGVNFWNEASSADQATGATLIRADDANQTFTLRKSPGRLQRVSTSTSNGLTSLDGIPLTMGFWGYTGTSGVGSREVYQWLTGSTISQNVSFKGYWANSQSAIVFTGYETCNNNGCSQSSMSYTKTITELINFGITDVHSWLNGVNTSYSFRIANGSWTGGTYSKNAISLAQIKLVKRTSENVAPNDSSIPSTLVCLGNCPSGTAGNLTDTTTNSWPPTNANRVDLTWDSNQGAPLISGSVPVDWTYSQVGHHYELFPTSSLASMDCPALGNSTGGYCTDQYKSSANSTYYTWQSGNRWDEYKYLVYRSGANAGQVVSPNPPLNLSYTVPDVPGNSSGYVGKTITVQSPSPGQIWLPGRCVDSLGNDKQCSSDTNWFNDVFIPTASDSSGRVTLLDNSGAATSTQYLVKWLKRGVYFPTLTSSNCANLDASLSLAANLSLPGIADANQTVKTFGLPWPSTAFDAAPRVVDGVLQ